jgi:hypothetical protein
MKILLACLIMLAAGVPTTAFAIILPVNIDMGTVTTSPSSGTYCGSTNNQLPGGLTQTSTQSSGGDVSFGTNAYTYAATADVTVVCVPISWNFASFGPFSGIARILFGSYFVTINVTGNYQFGTYSGAIFPKYQVLGIDYAPPGSRSSVTYSANFLRGGSASNSSTFTNQTTVTVSASLKYGIGSSNSLDTSVTGLYAQQKDFNTTDSWSVTTNGGDIIPGPASSAAGVDHDYDIVWIWLNPAVNLVLTGPASITWNGYSYNTADPVNQMDVLYLYVYELKDPSRIPPSVAARLARSWDQSGVGGLTAADYADILALNPFATNPAFDPTADTSGRYSKEPGQTFNYRPAPPGGQPVTQFFSTTAQVSNTTGTGTQITRSVAASVETKVNFTTLVSAAMKVTHTYTSVSKWNSAFTTTSGQTASFSITGPLASDNYTGPTALQIWRDNIYGSFMFHAAQ